MRRLTLLPLLLVLPAVACESPSAGSADALGRTTAALLEPPIAASAPQPHRRSLAPLVQEVRPTVVGVSAPGRGSRGSGVIIDSAGLILTNAHVLAGERKITVRTAAGEELAARVLGTDLDTDIALLEVKPASPLPAAHLGASGPLQVGDEVVAIGNPLGLELTVTSGIISAKARSLGNGPYDDFLQTDAAINPGNSGGPLFSLDGGVVGINTAIASHGQGLGFAVPIDLVKELLPQLQAHGRVSRGFLGVETQELTGTLASALGVVPGTGALIADLQPGGPAARAGLDVGDVIEALDGEPIGDAGSLTRAVGRRLPGAAVTLKVWQGGSSKELPVVLAERPSRELRRPPAPEPEAPPETALGVRIGPARGGGAVVLEVLPSSRAEKAGLQPGDRIVEVGKKPVRIPADLVEAVRGTGSGALLFRLYRGGRGLLAAAPPVATAADSDPGTPG